MNTVTADTITSQTIEILRDNLPGFEALWDKQHDHCQWEIRNCISEAVKRISDE